MGKFSCRKMVSCVLLILVPASLFAADSNAAMLYTSGIAWVNGAHVPRASSAIFSGDLLQTRSDSVANINQSGSSITVLSDSLVQFQGASLRVEHGAVTVSTSKAIGTIAGDVKVTPVSNAWTEFNVSDVDGLVRIAARKGDVVVDDGSSVVTLAQGQETTRDEASTDTKAKDGKKKSKKRAPGAAPAAGGGMLNSPIAIGVGAGIVGVAAIWVLTKNDNPVSPSQLP